MEIHTRTFKKICLLGFFILLAGCSGSDLVDSIPTQTTDPHSLSAQPFEVTFDGNTCLVIGPPELPPGEHSFILYNTSDMVVDLEVARFHPGKTLQDMFDVQEAPGVWWPKPRWVEYASAGKAVWSTDDGGKVWSYKLYMQAEYFIYVIIFDYTNDATENKLWLCQQFSVKESPSE